MNVVFRVDASITIGSGHVMRCLTMAEELRQRGAVCSFICREHPGNLISMIRGKGFVVFELSLQGTHSNVSSGLAHASWLGVSQKQDSSECGGVLAKIMPAWMVVDHYALDAEWEEVVRKYCRRIMVIDDLADRRHNCDLLLDQTYGRLPGDYKNMVPSRCVTLCSSKYALLRTEFHKWRKRALERRRQFKSCRHLLINLGGVDKDNVTGMVLMALSRSELSQKCKITVVMGSTAPCLNSVKELTLALPWRAEVKVGVDNMAELLTNSDVAIGAAGSSSWERCALGLPTLIVVLADNQKLIAKNLEGSGAAKVVNYTDSYEKIEISIRVFLSELENISDSYKEVSEAASRLADGRGVFRVANHLFI